MNRTRIISTIAAAACLVPAAAAYADTVVAADPSVGSVTALDRTTVWVSGTFGRQTLKQRTADGAVGGVKGAVTASSYRAIDLGRDTGNRMVLTYLRCSPSTTCVAMRDDLQGHRASIKGLEPRGCRHTTAPAAWRTRIAYGLFCTGAARSKTGLYVKTWGRSPRQQPLPGQAVRFGVDRVDSVDLRSTRVAAVVADIYEYAFTQTVTGTGRRSYLAAASEGESDSHARGLALGAANTMWTLTNSSHTGDPNSTSIRRLETGGCEGSEVLSSPEEGTPPFPFTDLAMDGDTMYLTAPGVGIVAHDYAEGTGHCPAGP